MEDKERRAGCQKWNIGSYKPGHAGTYATPAQPSYDVLSCIWFHRTERRKPVLIAKLLSHDTIWRLEMVSGRPGTADHWKQEAEELERQAGCHF